MDVSPICLGCMGFGDQARWPRPWLLDREKSTEIVKEALRLGVNWFDTANMYSLGASEEYLGYALKKLGAHREELVIQTKVNQRMGLGPNREGNSRKEIMFEIDESLKRLQMDYVDVYILHRWDYNTPIEETMEALNDVVKAGKARYIGASAMHAWQFEKAYRIAEQHGWSNFITMQNHVNLLYREEEKEMIPACKDAGVVCTPYSPLASGKLATPWGVENDRSGDVKVQQKYKKSEALDKPIVDRVEKLAKEKSDEERLDVALKREVGVSAEDIDIVILSHLHWDHAGQMDLFPNAEFWVRMDDVIDSINPIDRYKGTYESLITPLFLNIEFHVED
ncbi:MAG TPA: aldo/keto reductase [Candidatus Mediterraneibacter stercoripullorum]|nr:aldo/keto reductase [Candidatus Mediterraneibacter stercoripullorum]